MFDIYEACTSADIFAWPFSIKFEGKQSMYDKKRQVRSTSNNLMQGKCDEKVGYDTLTFFGGFMTSLMISSMSVYLIFRINTLYDARPYIY